MQIQEVVNRNNLAQQFTWRKLEVVADFQGKGEKPSGNQPINEHRTGQTSQLCTGQRHPDLIMPCGI